MILLVLTYNFLHSVTKQEIKAEIKRREEELAKSSQNVSTAGGAGASSVNNMNEQQGTFLGSTLTNIAVIVGFAAFAYTVKYVLRSIVE